jgi:catechol 2,3-dioxygenase-like lactoylglutathione lyase family enzyme
MDAPGDQRSRRSMMATFDAATTDGDPFLAILMIVNDQDRSRTFYQNVMGGEVLRDRDPAIIRFYNSNIILNTGGGPTNDKPGVTMAPPKDLDTVSIAMNIRVPDARAIYDTWRSRGAQFLTPPQNRGGEIRCYLRDPDGYLIEVGQTTRQEPSAPASPTRS